MSGTTFFGTFVNGIVLSNATTQNPATIAVGGYVGNIFAPPAYNGDAVYGKTGTAWTVVNNGSIVSAFAYSLSVGIDLKSGGSVTNGSTGSIAGKLAGVEIDGAAGTVTNLGTITASNEFGVSLLAGGSVTNGQSGSSAGLISGNGSGVLIEGGAGTVANFGTITASTGVGVFLTGGGRVTNGDSGASAGLISGANYGVRINGTAGTVANFATIAASAGDGVILNAGGSVTNGRSGSSAGLISGHKVGVKIAGAAGAVVNFGTITGSVGILINPTDTGKNTITNSGTIIGTGGSAVQFGAGNDTLIVKPVAVFTGAVSGGGGTNTVIQGAPGILTVTRFSAFETIHLAKGGADNLTLKNANFTGTSGMIWVYGGNAGNTANASQVTAASDRAIFSGGAGADHFTGGAGNDVFYAAANTTMTGGSGTNRFTFADIGTNGITDFAASAGNELVVRKSGFNLGTDESLANGTMQHLAASVFVANSTGTFTNAGQRFAYNTMTGALSYSATGSGSASSAVVVLSGHPSLSAGASGQIFFTS